MGRFLKIFMVFLSCLFFSCNGMTVLEEELDYLDDKADALRSWLDDTRGAAGLLQEIVTSLMEEERVVSVLAEYDPVTLEPVSYTVSFSGSDSLKIGLDGNDGTVPSISIGLYDGKYYWKSDGQWLTDADGDKVPVSSQELKYRCSDEIWYVSFDGGTDWVQMEEHRHVFSGVVDVIQSDSCVSFVLSDGTTLDFQYSVPVSFSLAKEGCVDAVPGASYSVSYTYSGADEPSVTLIANDYMGACHVTPTSEGKGTIYYSISDVYDVSLQKLIVVLNHARGTVSRELTFRQAGQLDIKPVEPILSEGGECMVSYDIEGYSSCEVTVTGGGEWLKFVSTSSDGSIYKADPNMGEESRIAEITFKVKNQYFSVLFEKKLHIVQFGTGGTPCHQEYVGNWTMSGMDRMNDDSFTAQLKILPHPDIAEAYQIYGLSPGKGGRLPVTAYFDKHTGKMVLPLPQRNLMNSDMCLCPVMYDGGNILVTDEVMEFAFTLNGNMMTADMDAERSFMFVSDAGVFYESDKTFYYDVTLNRDGVAEFYDDGEVVMLNEALPQYTPLNLVFLGDGYQKKDLKQGGKFERSAKGAMYSFFSVEPFKSFMDRFDVYMIPYASADEGPDVTSAGKVSDTYFSSVCAGGGNTLVTCDYQKVLDAVYELGFTEENNDLYRTVVILLVNTAEQSGSCWYIKAGKADVSEVGDGIKSMAIAMLAADTMGAGSLLRHEAGGHGFGRLADEYNWGGTADQAKINSLRDQQENYGFYWNVTAETGENSPWAHFIGLEGYEDVGYHEGAWGCSRGLYRPAANSIMLNNQGTFNAPSREIIYKRIILQSEGPENYSFEKFLEYDRMNL